jgi:hypothetical protein
MSLQQQCGGLFFDVVDDVEKFEAEMNEAIQQKNVAGAVVAGSLAMYASRVFITKFLNIKSTREFEIWAGQNEKNRSIFNNYAKLQNQLSGYQEQIQNSPSGSNNTNSGKGDDVGCYLFAELKFQQGDKECENWFSTIVGLKDLKANLLSMIIDPFIYKNLTDGRPKGILLYGPPGTGKTLLVKACVNEIKKQALGTGRNLKIFFYAPTAGDLKGSKVGQTEKFISAVYKCASDKAKAYESQNKSTNAQAISIIFIDEVDGVAGRREIDKNNVSSVNAFLQAIDGVRSGDKVLTIAATNFPWNLDPAFLERFDRQFLIRLPKTKDVTKLLNRRLNRMVASTITRYYSSDSKNETLQKQIDGCVDPSENSTYIWTDQRMNGFFRNLSYADIQQIAEYATGTPFPFTLNDQGEVIADGTNPPKTMKLSNRTMDKIFRQIRLSVLRKAKKTNLVVKIDNPYITGRNMYFSADCLDDDQWLSQFESLGLGKGLPPNTYYVFKRDDYYDLAIIKNSESIPAMVNSKTFPLIDVGKAGSNVENIYIGMKYGDEQTGDDEFYWDLFVFSKMYEDIIRGGTNVSTILHDYRDKYWRLFNDNKDQEIIQEFKNFKKLSTSAIYAKVKPNPYIPSEIKITELFKLKVHRFNRIKDSKYRVLIEMRVPIHDSDDRLKDAKIQVENEKAEKSLSELFSVHGMTIETLKRMSKGEMFKLLPSSHHNELNEVLSKLSGIRYEKIYISVEKTIRDTDQGILTKLAALLLSLAKKVTATVIGNNVIISQEKEFDDQAIAYRQLRKTQLSISNNTDGLFNDITTVDWLVPVYEADGSFSYKVYNTKIGTAKEYVGLAAETDYLQIFRNKTGDTPALWSDDFYKYIQTQYTPSVAIFQSEVSKNLELLFENSTVITTNTDIEQYYTSWNITFGDFMKELCNANTSLYDKELYFLDRYEKRPSEANQIRKEFTSIGEQYQSET